MKRVYLDVDGVLLGQESGSVILAPHATEFIDFLSENFDVYWLTTHCRGDARRVIDYLARFALPAFIERLAVVKATNFSVLKTEAVAGDFYWIDDSPLQAELTDLKARNLFDRWIEVNTRIRPDDLLFAMDELSSILASTRLRVASVI